MIDLTNDELNLIQIVMGDAIEPAEKFLNSLTDNRELSVLLSAYLSGKLERAIKTARVGNEIILKTFEELEEPEKVEEIREEIEDCLDLIKQWEKKLDQLKSCVRIVGCDEN
ncbi:MAG: hypothetical protein QNJ72_26190 [Pleurocapsa sp. MO_226.B13]|nr:hypothetical protein [Pleurocapsa sp. MO_226.B13]